MAVGRISFSLFFVLLFCFSRNINAQSNIPLLERKASVHATNQLPEEILRSVSQQGNFTFSYDPQLIKDLKPVTIDLKNKTVREVLDRVFGSQITYKEKGSHIILIKTTSETVIKETSYFIVTGYIKDGVNGNEVAKASIFDKKSKESAVSDKYGHFNLKVNNKLKDQVLQLSVNKIDYKDTLVYVKQTGRSTISITIYPQTKQSDSDTSIVTDSLSVNQLGLVEILLSDEEQANTLNINDTLYDKFQLSFLPFIGTNLKLSGNTVNDYSLNVLAGYSMGTRKLEVAGLVNIDRDSVKHVQLAGLANVAGGPVQGLQTAGLINFNMKTVRGCQIAGLINSNADTSHAVQVAGLLNVNLKPSNSFLAAGLMNVNIRSSNSPQLAGLLNVTVGDAKGAQIAGLLNVCTKNLNGVQVAGLVNYAKHIHGSQVGFLNIADSCSGVPVGFLSFVRKGYHELEVSSDEIYPVNVSLRTGVHAFYNILSAGMKLENTSDISWYFGYGLGSAVNLGKKWDLNFDLTVNQPIQGNNLDYFNPHGKFNLTVEKRLTKYFSIAAGPSFNMFFANTTDLQYDQFYKNIPPANVLNSTVRGDYEQTSWIGAKIALRFF